MPGRLEIVPETDLYWPDMRNRAGEILYYGGCIGAAIVSTLAAVGILLNVGHENGAAIVRTLTVAALAWGAGRTALHFLAGR